MLQKAGGPGRTGLHLLKSLSHCLVSRCRDFALPVVPSLFLQILGKSFEPSVLSWTDGVSPCVRISGICAPDRSEAAGNGY